MRISISWVAKQGFCEYKIYLEQVKHIKPSLPLGECVATGIKAHESLHDMAVSTADNLDSSIDEIAADTLSTGIVSTRREVFVKGKRIIGSIDEVQITKECVFIIDDKSRSAVKENHYGDIRQVQAYALAFRESFNVSLPLVAVIRNVDTSEWLWQKPVTVGDIKDVNNTLDRIDNIIKELQPAVPTRNPKKCAVCEYAAQCDNYVV